MSNLNEKVDLSSIENNGNTHKNCSLMYKTTQSRVLLSQLLL